MNFIKCIYSVIYHKSHMTAARATLVSINSDSYHIGCRAVLVALESLQGHPTYRSVLIITETMVILREEISSQGSVSQSHTKAARFDQAISGGDIPGNEIIDSETIALTFRR